MQPYKPDYTPKESIWAESGGRFPIDDLLRFYGFEIKSRDKNKPPKWKSPQGVLMDQEDAVAEVQRLKQHASINTGDS